MHSMLHVPGLLTFRNHKKKNQNFERSPTEGLPSEMFKFEMQHKEPPLIFGTRKMVLQNFLPYI